MRTQSRFFFFLLFGLLAYGGTLSVLSPQRTDFLSYNYIAYTLPSEAIGPISLEFKGIVSDFLFLKMITHYGEKIGNKEKLDERHADFLYTTTEAITDLDPWFWDAYLVADMNLTWGFGQFDKANKLLLKAKRYRSYDYKVPYFIGFNYFYFLKDSVNAAKYLREAASFPDSPETLPYLASRVSLYANDHRAAIQFIIDVLKTIKNKQMIDQLKIRMEALVHLDILERKVLEFRQIYHENPKSLEDLVGKGLIREIPKDPYGGKFYLLNTGDRVYTTSDLRFKK